MILWLDFETRSRCDLPSAGAYNYAQDASTELLCMSYAFGDEDVATWLPGQPLPARVAQHRGQIRAHNAAFERLIFWYVLAPEQDFPEPALEQFYCTATQARANCGPGSLEDVGRFAGASMKKDHRGAQLIRALCIPKPDGTFREDPALMAELVLYCEQDVRAMRAVSKAMRDLSEEELADYHVNERINDRGVLVDTALCAAAARYAAQELTEIEQTVREVTAGAITSVRSPKMRAWVEHRVGPEARKLMIVYKDGEAKVSIDKTVRANLLALADENPDEVPPDVAEVIQCADDLWASSVAKFNRAAALADKEDNRVRGAFVFAGGAATGRASSYGLQVHNFPRKCAAAPDDVRQAMVRGHQIVPAHGKRVTDVLKGMLRPAMMPSPGKVLAAADWSAIEARVNPWLSGNGEAKLELFRTGQDVYKVNAAATFRVPVDEVTKDQRQVGKVQELACLSEDTLVLTVCGEKRIQDVLPGDHVWDGVNWVRTDGPIYKGERHVIEYDGLCATPDHLVWVEGSSDPVEMGWAAANGVRLAQVWPRFEAGISIFGETAVGGEAAVRKPELAGVSYLWGQGCDICVPYGARCVHLGFGEPWAAAREHGDGPRKQLRGLRAGEFTLVHQSAEPPAHVKDGEHRGVPSVSSDISAHQVRRQHTQEPAIYGVDVRADCRSVEQPKLQTKRRVWDLLNCGPLHRFTAQGRLVHNCGFAGGVGAFAAMGRVYGVHLPESEARRMVDAWRRANPWAMPFWQALEGAYTRAMRNRGREFSAGLITYLFDGTHLWYALPSGRVLCYPFAKLEADGVTYAKASWKPAADATEWPRARLWRGLACIAKDTPVLTDRGWVPIQNVAREDKIWDGDEWVCHEGLAHQGYGRVILAHGVSMTPDHLVLTVEGWVRADESERYGRAASGAPDIRDVGGVERDDFVVPNTTGGDGRGFVGASEQYAEVFDLVNCGPRRRFVVQDASGGMLIVHNCENVTQAAAHDLLRASLRRLDAEGQEVVLHVHDEIVCETADPDATVAAMRRAMCTPPNWAGGIPLDIEAEVMTRYGK